MKLCNSALPLLLGSGAAIVELTLGRNPVFMSGSAILLVAGFCSLIVQGRRLGH